MKTCRHCRSEDIPDAATHCKHCGKRLNPSQVPVVLVLLGLVLLILYGFWAGLISPALTKADAEKQARELIDQAKISCTPETPEEVADQLQHETEDKIDHLDLDPQEKFAFETALDSQLNALGCGFNARHQPKRTPKRR